MSFAWVELPLDFFAGVLFAGILDTIEVKNKVLLGFMVFGQEPWLARYWFFFWELCWEIKLEQNSLSIFEYYHNYCQKFINKGKTLINLF